MNPVMLGQHATEHVRDMITEAGGARSGPRHQRAAAQPCEALGL